MIVIQNDNIFDNYLAKNSSKTYFAFWDLW